MKSSDQGEQDQSDSTLFDQAMRDVKRVDHKQAVLKRVPAAPNPAPPVFPEAASEFGEELRYLRPGIQKSFLQKLRRGQFRIEAILDLHGHTLAEASVRLQHFLQESQMAGRSAVRIVHGKGHGSIARQPVLKGRVQLLLQECPSVLAFCSARQQDGGTGAVDVLLRKAKSVR